MKALFISNDNPPPHLEANTSYFRILIPMAYLIGAGHEIVHQATPPRSRDSYWVDTLDWREIPETVLVERMVDPERIKKLRLAGAKRIVMTFDDNYEKMPQYSAAAPFWKQFLPGFLDALPLVDEVIVPSEQLAKDFRKRCRKITVVPNFHDPKLWEGEARKNDKLTIGWGGSEQHVQSWTGSGIIPALKRVLERHPDWQLVIYCPVVSNLLEGFSIPFVRRGWVPFEQWPGEVRGFDIGLAPLHGEYDRRRSFLKILEYGLSGKPFIATHDVPYAGVIGGELVRNTDIAWENSLEMFIGSSDDREWFGCRSKNWAERYTMDKNVSAYEQVLWPS